MYCLVHYEELTLNTKFCCRHHRPSTILTFFAHLVIALGHLMSFLDQTLGGDNVLFTSLLQSFLPVKVCDWQELTINCAFQLQKRWIIVSA